MTQSFKWTLGADTIEYAAGSCIGAQELGWHFSLCQVVKHLARAVQRNDVIDVHLVEGCNGRTSAELQRAWYRGQVAKFFSFNEAPLSAAGTNVPISPIYVTFNVNPGEPWWAGFRFPDRA